MPDIDIDLSNRDRILNIIKHIPASINNSGELKRHNVGVYLQDIPHDPLSELATIEYKEAEERGYFKFDILNVNGYGLDKVKSHEHLTKLVETEPEWSMLEYEEIVDTLFHLNGNFETVSKIKPTSVEQLAMTLALLRPGKKHLIGETWENIEKEIWKPVDGYYFKKAHSFGYAIAIVVQMNLMMEDNVE